MGYSIHWLRPREFTTAAFDLFQTDAARIIKYAETQGFVVAGGEGSGDPTFTPVGICFNGARGNGGFCEPFSLPRSMDPSECRRPNSNGMFWQHTKTEYLSYGTVGIAVLLALSHTFPEVVIETDNGPLDGSDPGVALYEQAMGRKALLASGEA